MGQQQGGDGDWLAILLIPIAHSSWFAPLCSLLILMVAAGLAMLLLVRLEGPRRSIVSARRLVMAPAGPAAFAQAFESIDGTLTTDPALGHAWTEFRKTLLRRPERDRIDYTIRPEQYFTAPSLANGVVNIDLFRAVPNYLVGVGLLFTFIGLVAALYFAGRGVTAKDIHDAQESLKLLLQSATFKFMTSIAGLGGSILFSIVQKRALGRLAGLTAGFCHALEVQMDLVTPVALAEQSYRELHKFNTELGASIASALDVTIGATMGRVMQPMADLLERMTDSMAEMSREAIERMLTLFTDRLQGAASQEMGKLIEALRTVHDSLAGLIAGIDQGRRALNEELLRTAQELGGRLTNAGDATAGRIFEAGVSIEGAATQAGGALVKAGLDLSKRLGEAGLAVETALVRGAGAVEEKIAGSAASLGGATSDFEEGLQRSTTLFGDKVAATAEVLGNAWAPLAERLSTLMSGLAAVEEGVAQQQAALATLVRELGDAASSVRDAAAEVGGAAAPIGRAAAQMEAGAAQLTVTGTSLGALNQEFGGLAIALRDSSALLSKTWESTDRRLGSLDDSMAQVFDQLREGLETYRASIQAFVGDIDRGMAQSVGLLSGTIGELSDVVDGLSSLRRHPDGSG